MFWKRWIIFMGIVITLFGIFMAFSSGTPLFKMFDMNINRAFWKGEEITSAIRNFQKWVYGAWGATVAGWGIFIILLAEHAFDRREKWVWRCMLLGLLIWFLLDTGFSLYFKVYINVALNSIIFFLFILPLIFTKRFFD